MRVAARSVGLLSSLGAFGLYLIFLFFNPYRPGALTLPVWAMMALALAGAWAAWRGWSRRMLAISVLSFAPVGLYLLGTPGIFRWIGVLNLAGGAAALVWMWAGRRS
jgi:hypothetical protein